MAKFCIKYLNILTILMIFGIGGAHSFENMHIHGFISQGYIQSDKNNYLAETEDGSFQYNEMGINFLNQTTKKLNIGVQFFARDLGDTGNDAITMDWAFADYHYKDYFGIRAGRIKNPFGFYHENRDLDMLRTNVLLPISVYSEFMRDALIAINGVGIYGEMMNGSLGYVNYNFLVGTNNVSPDGGTASYIGASSFNITNVTIENMYSGSLTWLDPGGRLKIGGSVIWVTGAKFYGESTKYFSDSKGFPADHLVTIELKDILSWVISIEYTLHSFVFASEYRRQNGDSQLTIPPLPPFPDFKNPKSEGYYAMVSYRFNSFVELGCYYSVNYPNKDDKNGDDFKVRIEAWRKDTALSVRFDINENWLFKLEGHYLDGVAPMLDKMNPDGFDRYWKLYVAKLSFVF